MLDMESLRKAFRELSVQYFQEINGGSERVARILQQVHSTCKHAIKDVMAAMKNYCPAPLDYTDPINLDP